MPVISSVLGASLSSSNTTQLFTLNTKVNGTGNSEWAYVQATGTFTTGVFVNINPTGTAFALTTALVNSPGVNGLDIGVLQFTISRDEYGFVVKRGSNMYVLCTGTIAAGTGVGLAANTGTLQAMPSVGVGTTLAGIHITTSASTGTASLGIATLTWPRSLVNTGYQA